MDITDEQWAIIKPFIPQPVPRADGKGRPRVDDRAIMNGILWILRTGAPWQDLPGRYPSRPTCHRRFQSWSRDGTLERILQALAQDLLKRGKLDVRESFIDGSFAAAKKGASSSGKPSAAKGPRSWQLQTAMAFLSPQGLQALRRMK
jgi:transposase